MRRRVLMLVGNKLQGDSRVLKTAASLATRGFSVLLVGAERLDGDARIGKIGSIPALWLNSAELKLNMGQQAHQEAFAQITKRLNASLVNARFGVVYSHDYLGLEMAAAVVRAWGHRQSVYWVHDVHEYVRGYEGILPEGRLAWVIESERRLIGLPDRHVFVNERIADLVCAEHGLTDRAGSHVVHNAPRTQVPSQFNLRGRIGLDAAVPLGVYLGRATPARGLGVLVGALQARPALHFALLSGDSPYTSELKEAAKAAGVDGRLHVFPYVPDNEVASAAASATFGISPLTRYGNADLAVPTKVLECIHARLPLVVSDSTFQADFVREHHLGEVFVSQDDADFAAAIDRVLAAPPRPDFEMLQARFNWDAQFEQVAADLQAHADGQELRPRGVLLGPDAGDGGLAHLARALRAADQAVQAVGLSAGPAGDTEPLPGFGAREPQEQAAAAMWALERFPLWHLQRRPVVDDRQGESFAGLAFVDFMLARGAGIPLVFGFGDDARLNADFKRLSPLAWDEAEDPSGLTDVLKLQLLAKVREFATVAVVPDPELQGYVPEARIVPPAVDQAQLPAATPLRRNRPKVLHAPPPHCAREAAVVQAAVEALRQEGLEFDFVAPGPLPWPALATELADADIVIDRLSTGWYGSQGIAAMALGKAVVAHLRDDLALQLATPGAVANASVSNLQPVLRGLIQDADARSALAECGLSHARKYHSAEAVAQALRQVYADAALVCHRPALHGVLDLLVRQGGQLAAATDKPTTPASAAKAQPGVESTAPAALNAAADAMAASIEKVANAANAVATAALTAAHAASAAAAAAAKAVEVINSQAAAASPSVASLGDTSKAPLTGESERTHGVAPR